jgi:hypothetical protein
MAFNPSQQKFSFRLPVLDGGLNTKSTDVSIPLNASPDCQNVLFDEFGAIRTAYGYQQAYAIATGAAIDCLGVYGSPGAMNLLAACDGSLWRVAGASFVVITGATGIYSAPSPTMDSLNANSYAIFSNGVFVAHKYDGTNFTEYGIRAPTSAPAAAATGAAGLLNGTYQYAMTNVNSYGAESDYTLIVTAITAALKQVTLSGLPTGKASWGVDYKNIYRTTAAGGTLFWLVTSVSGGATSVTDNNADSSLVVEAPLDQGFPPKAKYMTYYQGRVWAAGDPSYPYRLYFSEAGEPEKWPSTNYIDIEVGDFMPISAIEAFGNAIIIHKNDGQSFGAIYLLYISDSTGASDPTNWYVFKSPAAFSAVSQKSQAFFRNLLFYLNRNGAYALSGQDLARTAADSEQGRFQTENLAYEIDPDVKAWNSAYLSKAAAIQYDNKLWIAVPAGNDSGGLPYTVNSKLYVYDFVRLNEKLGVWSKVGYPGITDFQVCNGDLYGGGQDGVVHKLNTGVTFNGATVDPYYMTAPISGFDEHRDNVKVFRILYITHDQPGTWALTVEWYTDFVTSPTGSTSIVLADDIAAWDDTFLWDESVWDGPITRRSRIILTNAVGKIVQFKFKVTGVGATFKLKEITLDYNLRSKRG